MTAAGLITLAGLLISFFYVRAERICTCVQKAWWCLFVPFVSVSISVNIGADAGSHFWLYAFPAIIGGSAILLLLWPQLTPAMWAFLAIFPINVVGNAIGLDQYKLATIDILDALVWAQILLLWRLREENPDDVLAHEPGRQNKNNNVIRVIHGTGGAGTRTKA